MMIFLLPVDYYEFILLVIDRSMMDDDYDDDQLSFRFQFNFSHTSIYLRLLFYMDLINKIHLELLIFNN